MPKNTLQLPSAAELLVALQELRSYLFDFEAFQNPIKKKLIQGTKCEILHYFEDLLMDEVALNLLHV
jgi:hypothetical protein